MPTIAVSNQCYLQDGQCNSGLHWHYKVLVKGVLDGKSVCVIPNVWISEWDFIPFSEATFSPGEFYKDDRQHVYKCVFKNGKPLFIYVGFIRSDGTYSRDNHITPKKYTPWQRRKFHPYKIK